MLLDETEEDSESFVIWTQIISKDRSKITCTLEDNGQKVTLRRTVGTGSDITVISTSKWPPGWALIPCSQSPYGEVKALV